MAYRNYSGGYNRFNKFQKPVIERKPRFMPPAGWLPQFEAVFNAAINTKDNLAVEAVAGSGKTTCLVELCYRLVEAFPNIKILAIAFNSSIRKELQSRMPPGVVVETCHSFNFKIVCRVWGEGKAVFDLQGPKGSIAQKLAEAAIGPEEEKADDRDALMQAMSLAKTRLAENEEQILEVMDRWSIETTYDKKVFAKHVLWMMQQTQKGPFTGEVQLPDQKKKRGRPKKTVAAGKKAISFDDQIWLPIVNDLYSTEKYDVVLIDEAQDLSPARTQVAMRAVKEGGRIIAVGDVFQAIYAFSGADIHALPELIETIKATKLPLSCSFRCAKNIVKEAQVLNPVIEASTDAIDGTVDEISVQDLMNVAKPGEAIISRTNAPLIKLFFKLAKRGNRVCLLGRDYGAMIIHRINIWERGTKKSGRRFTGNVLLEKNDEWLVEQLEQAKKKKTSGERYIDEHETIVALAEDLYESLSSESSVREIIDRVKNMFSDDEKKEEENHSGCITLSSTHKFKGLERDRVYMLASTYKEDTQEEINISYVARTRAKKHLSYVTGNLKGI